MPPQAADFKLSIGPLEPASSLRHLAYDAIKKAIMAMDIYGQPDEIRLDERQLSSELGVSRTPIREALTLLEQEGFVRSLPRRGIFVTRKSKREVLEMITVWAALESMAARLAALRASDAELAALSDLFHDFERPPLAGHMNEYSQANILFHQTIVGLGGCRLIVDMTQNLFVHVRAVRAVSIRQGGRAERSMAEHAAIVEALAARDAERAGGLVRDHALGLAAHVDAHWTLGE